MCRIASPQSGLDTRTPALYAEGMTLKAFNLILVALALTGCLAVIVALSDPSPSIDGAWLRPAPGLATPSLRKWVEASPLLWQNAND